MQQHLMMGWLGQAFPFRPSASGNKDVGLRKDAIRGFARGRLAAPQRSFRLWACAVAQSVSMCRSHSALPRLVWRGVQRACRLLPIWV